MPDARLTGYLLSESHPQGRPKAALFRALGFRNDDPEPLRRVLPDSAVTSEMTETLFAFGTKYVGMGEFVPPTGARVSLRTVWVIPPTGPPPLLVTAYPA